MTTMRPTTDTNRAVPVLLAAVVASIVLGIVGMHALSLGGVADNTDHSTMSSPMTGSMTGAHNDMSAAADTSPNVGAGMPADPDSGKGHDMGSMVMLCLAMLAAAGALLLLFLGLRRRPRVWDHRPTAPTAVTRWVTARLGTGPPYVWEFSVIRC